MERRTTAKRRHVHADLNNPDATSTLAAAPTSSFIPYPSEVHRSHQAHDFSRPSTLAIPPAYQQPFNRRANLDNTGDVTPQERGSMGLTIRNGRKWFRQFASGLGDALRLQSSLNIISSDAELRAQVIKSSLVNLICLSAIFVFDNLVYPAIKPANLSEAAFSKAHHVKTFFDLFCKFPIFAFCFWINASWSASISKRALVVQYPTSRQAQIEPNTGNPNVFRKVLASLPRFLLILDYQVTALFLSYIPIIGKPLMFSYACLLNAYYCFDFSFSTRGWNLRAVAKHMRQKATYFLGFGLVPSLLCGFGPLLLNMAIFALIYPLLVLQALQARAVPALSLEDATTSLPLSPFPTGVPGTPFLSHSGSPIGTPITTGNGLPPLSPNGYSPADEAFSFPNVTSDQISARFQAMGDGLLEGDDDEGGSRGGHKLDHWKRDDSRSRSLWEKPRRYAIRATRLARQVPLFWIATSTQEMMRWFVLGLERRWGRSGGSMFIPESRRSSGSGSTGSATGSGWAAAKRRKSSYR